MMGPETTTEVSAASGVGGAAGAGAAVAAGTGFALVAADVSLLESPQPTTSKTAPIASNSIQLLMLLLRSISTSPPSSRSLRRAKGLAAGRKHRPRDTSQFALFRGLPCRHESRHRDSRRQHARKRRASRAEVLPWD